MEPLWSFIVGERAPVAMPLLSDHSDPKVKNVHPRDVEATENKESFTTQKNFNLLAFRLGLLFFVKYCAPCVSVGKTKKDFYNFLSTSITKCL
jgi:hypothetical protein